MDRSGTEPVALAVGMACALEAAHREMSDRNAKVCRLRELLVSSWRERGIEFVVNGPDESSGAGLPHVLNVSFSGCNADVGFRPLLPPSSDPQWIGGCVLDSVFGPWMLSGMFTRDISARTSTTLNTVHRKH